MWLQMNKQKPKIPNSQRGFIEGWAIMTIVWRKTFSSTMYNIPNLTAEIENTYCVLYN